MAKLPVISGEKAVKSSLRLAGKLIELLETMILRKEGSPVTLSVPLHKAPHMIVSFRNSLC